ncbi:MAG TPA: type II toxin-antitoxin system HigB family toxin [Pirellulales bacterium]|nr:type II toxin-antitoxin system HigB family toxin [Pirellulales bacterium]
MRIISKKKLREFWQKHSAAERPLRAWRQTVKASKWANFAEVRETYADADQVGLCTVFNIGGNKFRLIAAIHYNRGIIYIRNVLTHAEYDMGKWKEKCQ